MRALLLEHSCVPVFLSAKLGEGQLLDDAELAALAAMQAEQQRGARAAWR